jgi:hypothetical protein
VKSSSDYILSQTFLRVYSGNGILAVLPAELPQKRIRSRHRHGALLPLPSEKNRGRRDRKWSPCRVVIRLSALCDYRHAHGEPVSLGSSFTVIVQPPEVVSV